LTVSPSESVPPLIRSNPSAPPDEPPEHDLHHAVVELARALPGDLRRLTVRTGDRAIEVEWAAESVGPRPAAGPEPGWTGQPMPVPDADVAAVAVRAPLVGTFYGAPSPGADPFVRLGDTVETGQTLGIVEAMKLMNPIVADEPGVVAEILVADAESVEYDQVLMRLHPPGGPR
jgi:acetyl-CoA carboxylase biotin carboxyl carrier protein